MQPLQPPEDPCLALILRYYNNFDHDHVYTSNYKKWGKGGSYRTPDGEHGYTYEGVAFYIYKFPRQGAK